MRLSIFCGNSSVGRASASQAEGREFESRFPLIQKRPPSGGLFLYERYYEEIRTRDLPPRGCHAGGMTGVYVKANAQANAQANRKVA